MSRPTSIILLGDLLFGVDDRLLQGVAKGVAGDRADRRILFRQLVVPVLQDLHVVRVDAVGHRVATLSPQGTFLPESSWLSTTGDTTHLIGRSAFVLELHA